MAMNKKEQEMVEALRAELAFRRTAPVAPDIDPPEMGNELRKGWLFNAYNSQTVPACTTCVSHSYGDDTRASSQGPCKLYSTRLRALQALRWAVEQDCVQRLRKIDRQIEQVTSEQKGS